MNVPKRVFKILSLIIALTIGSCPKIRPSGPVLIAPIVSVRPVVNIVSVMRYYYNARPCTDQSLIDRFNQIQDVLQIKNKVLLFETAKIQSDSFSASAAYEPLHQIVITHQRSWWLSGCEQSQGLPVMSIYYNYFI